jgi:hypothetical protein
MARTEEEQKNWEIQAYGCRSKALDQVRERQKDDPTMLAMSILSDAQEELARGDSETARQFMNRAKYVIGKVKDDHYPHPSRINRCKSCNNHVTGTLKLDDGTVIPSKNWDGR